MLILLFWGMPIAPGDLFLMDCFLYMLLFLNLIFRVFDLLDILLFSSLCLDYMIVQFLTRELYICAVKNECFIFSM